MAELTSSLRFLHLEDNCFDADLLQHALHAQGVLAKLDHVLDWQEFQQRLQAERYDVIFSDYCVPETDVPSVLKVVREKQPDTPVIIISGTIGEDQAVQCLHLGATDYLIKGRLERLGTAIHRALEESRQREERQKLANQLRQNEALFTRFVEHSRDVVWTVDLNPERMIYVSPSVEAVFGLPAADFHQDARLWLKAVHAEDRERVVTHWESCVQGQNPAADLEYRIVRPDGTCRWILDTTTVLFDDAGRPERIAGTCKDITERKQAETQLLRSQRLESIGTLAGGIAHDLNNTLAPILMSAELLRLQHPATSNFSERIEKSAQRAAAMVRQLLTFAKGVEGSRVLVNTGHVLAEMENLVKSTFPKSIKCHVSYPLGLPAVLGDPTQLHQVLLNLCVNARDAMPAGGDLKIKAKVGSHTDSEPVAGLKPGRYVVWEVSDSGLGIAPEVVERMFEPFFTTKTAAGGTGLGLSTVRGIVENHGGAIDVHSEVGKGSTFFVYLPLADGETPAADSLPEDDMPFKGRGELILVVDDEAEVRQAMRAALTGMNFRVITFADGMQALYDAFDERDAIAAVIVDLHMPGVDGVTFTHLLKRLVPDANIIVSSGNLDSESQSLFRNLGVHDILHKPFTQRQLAQSLQSLLDSAPTGGLESNVGASRGAMAAL